MKGCACKCIVCLRPQSLQLSSIKMVHLGRGCHLTTGNSSSARWALLFVGMMGKDEMMPSLCLLSLSKDSSLCTVGSHLAKETATLSCKLPGYIIPLRWGAEISVGCGACPACKAQGAHHSLDVCHVGGRKLDKVLSCILQRSFLPCKGDTHTHSCCGAAFCPESRGFTVLLLLLVQCIAMSREDTELATSCTCLY